MDEGEVEAPQHGATSPVASSTANDAVVTQEVEPTASAKPKTRTRGKPSIAKPRGTEIYVCFASKKKIVTKHLEHIISHAVRESIITTLNVQHSDSVCGGVDGGGDSILLNVVTPCS